MGKFQLEQYSAEPKVLKKGHNFCIRKLLSFKKQFLAYHGTLAETNCLVMEYQVITWPELPIVS